MTISPLSLLLWLCGILTIVLMFVLLLPENPKDYLVLISAIAVVIGVSIAQAVKLFSEQRDRAFSLLQLERENDEIINARKTLTPAIREKGIFTKDELLDLFNSPDKNKRKIGESMLIMADFFEQIAIAIDARHVNETLLREFYIGIFIRFYRSIKHLIPLIRNNPPIVNSPFGNEQRPEVFIYLDYLYKRWLPIYIQMIRDKC